MPRNVDSKEAGMTGFFPFGAAMAISSLQSLIEKYGANFGISARTLAEFKAAQEKENGDAAETDSAQPAEPKGKDGDTVELSPEALAYQKAHTSPTGKFQAPNLFGDMLSAFDNAAGTADAGTSSLMDFLGNPQEAESTEAAANDPTSYFNNLGRMLGNREAPVIPKAGGSVS